MLELSHERGLDFYIAYIGLFLSVSIAAYLALAGARWILVITGLAAAIAFLVWILVKGKASLDSPAGTPSHHFGKSLLFAFIFLTMCTLLLLVYNPNQYSRPDCYFMIVSIQSGIVAIQVLHSKLTRMNISLILLQIMFIGISLDLSESFLFPSVIGVDSWAHQQFTNEMITTGYVPEGWVYSSMPIFHIDICTTSIITTFGYKIASICSVSIIQIIINTLMVFLLGTRLFEEKQGLLAALFLSFANYHLQLGFWIVPNTLGVVMIPLALYLILTSKNQRTIGRIVAATVILITLVLMHSMSSFAMVVSLIIGWIAFESYRKTANRFSSNHISLRMTMFIAISMVSLWSLAAPILFSRTLELIMGGFDVGLFSSASDEVLEYAATGVPLIEQLSNNLGFLAFFGISLIGCLYMISRKGNSMTFAFSIIGLVTLIISFVGLIVGKSVLENRWWYLAQVLLCIPLAASIFLLASRVKPGLRKTFFIFTITSLVAFFMICSPVANIDNRTLSPNSGVRYALTESEITSAEYCSHIAENWIGTDVYYASTQQATGLDFSPIDEEFLSKDFDEIGNHIILIREEVVSNSFILSSGLWKLDYDPCALLDEQHYSKIFDCDSVTGWYIV